MRKQQKKPKLFFILFLVIIIAILFFNITIMIKSFVHPNIVPDFFGYKPFTVLSGSMESSINIGDLVVVKEIDSNKLKTNDIIAFKDPDGTVTTHRIIEVIDETNDYCFKTKGDSNNVEDNNIVCSGDIEGKYIFKIKKLGNFIIFIQEPVGFCVMMLVLFIIGLITFMVVNYRIDKKNIKLDDEYMKEYEEYKKLKNKDIARKNDDSK